MKYKYFNILLYLGVSTSVAIMPLVLTNCKKTEVKKIYLSELKKGDKLVNAKACWNDNWYEDFYNLNVNDPDYQYEAVINCLMDGSVDYSLGIIWLNNGIGGSNTFFEEMDTLIDYDCFPCLWHYEQIGDSYFMYVISDWISNSDDTRWTFEVTWDNWVDCSSGNEFIFPEEVKYTFWFEY